MRAMTKPTGKSKPGTVENLVALNFRVSESFHKEFKHYSVEHRIPMVELIVRAFEALKEKTKKEKA
jgi:hypothetical protein